MMPVISFGPLAVCWSYFTSQIKDKYATAELISTCGVSDQICKNQPIYVKDL